MDRRTPSDPFAEHVMATVLEASPRQAVVVQGDHAELENHVGVRHASALFAGASAAARALVEAALGDRAHGADLRHGSSEIAYSSLPLGPITSTAVPSGEGWTTLDADLAAGNGAQLGVRVTSVNTDGRDVVTLDATWQVELVDDGTS